MASCSHGRGVDGKVDTGLGHRMLLIPLRGFELVLESCHVLLSLGFVAIIGVCNWDQSLLSGWMRAFFRTIEMTRVLLS